jgi:hypothetical protein
LHLADAKIKEMRRASLLLLLACTAFGAAAPKPDFSGEWILNLNRSEYGAQAAPKNIVQKIIHKDPDMTIDYLETSPFDQSVKYTSKYRTDGKETSNLVLGNEVKSTVAWDGRELSVHSWMTFGGRNIDMKDRWKLAENGTTLIIVRHLEGNAGVFDQTIVFDKK